MENAPQGLYAAALVDAHLGKVDEARTGAERGAAMAAQIGQEFWAIANRRVLGFLELSLGNPARAVEYLHPPRRIRITSLLHMPSNCEFIETGIEAFVAVGDLETAGELLSALQDRAGRIDSPWERAIRRSEEHTSELQSHHDLVCRLLLEKKKKKKKIQVKIEQKLRKIHRYRPQ